MESPPRRRSWRVKLLALAAVLLLCLLGAEVLAGYVWFLRTRHCPALIAGLRRAGAYFSRSREERDLLVFPASRVDGEANPFVAYSPGATYRPHPLVDYSGVFGLHPESIRLDYFGYRNRSDLYFAPKDSTLVVFTGGSEAAGYSHRVPISEHLERILTERSGRRFKVLNLAMNAYTVSNEVSTYVHLAHHLKPEFVISHSGWNDLMNGMMVPYNFKRLGVYYPRVMERWLPRFHHLDEETRWRHWVYNEKGVELVPEGYLRTLEKYRRLVEPNGGQFISGLQGYKREISGIENLCLRKVRELYREVAARADGRSMIDFTAREDLVYVDHCHTGDDSSLRIAETYAGEILARLRVSRRDDD